MEERRRDVAALRLLGISRRTVTGAVVLEASCIAVLGRAAGVAFGYVCSAIINWYYRGVYRTPLAFSLVTPGTVVFSVALSLVLGIGAGLLAARGRPRAAARQLDGRPRGGTRAGGVPCSAGVGSVGPETWTCWALSPATARWR